MRKFDAKHIAFHVLVALYFIWFFLFGILIAMALDNFYGLHNSALSRVFMIWIFLNLLMGTALFIVIRLFGNTGGLSRFIQYSYGIMALAAVTTAAIIELGP